MAIAIGVLVIVFIAVVIVGSSFLRKRENRRFGVTIKVAKVNPLLHALSLNGKTRLDYSADKTPAAWPRGAQIHFSILPNSGTGEGVKLGMMELLVRSFTPLDKLPAPPEYAPPISSEQREEEIDVDLAVRISIDGKPAGSVTWSPQLFEVGPEGWSCTGKPIAQAPYPCSMKLVPAPMAVPLSSINRLKPHEFLAQVILDTPGKAVVGFRISYLAGAKPFIAESQESTTIVFNPAFDFGSTPFLKADFEAHPTFNRARAYRDKLLAEGNGHDALAVAQAGRRKDDSPDAEWLLGDTYRALGRNQEAVENGLYAFYLHSDDLAGERLRRWTDNKKWLTEKVEAGIVKLPGK